MTHEYHNFLADSVVKASKKLPVDFFPSNTYYGGSDTFGQEVGESCFFNSFCKYLGDNYNNAYVYVTIHSYELPKTVTRPGDIIPFNSHVWCGTLENGDFQAALTLEQAPQFLDKDGKATFGVIIPRPATFFSEFTISGLPGEDTKEGYLRECFDDVGRKLGLGYGQLKPDKRKKKQMEKIKKALTKQYKKQRVEFDFVGVMFAPSQDYEGEDNPVWIKQKVTNQDLIGGLIPNKDYEGFMRENAKQSLNLVKIFKDYRSEMFAQADAQYKNSDKYSIVENVRKDYESMRDDKESIGEFPKDNIKNPVSIELSIVDLEKGIDLTIYNILQEGIFYRDNGKKGNYSKMVTLVSTVPLQKMIDRREESSIILDTKAVLGEIVSGIKQGAYSLSYKKRAYNPAAIMLKDIFTSVELFNQDSAGTRLGDN